ncbi:MFS transporter [Amycolatopsis pithecellobii]|nr:MFS transporter [Amycolatopsis pithecellobii]
MTSPDAATATAGSGGVARKAVVAAAVLGLLMAAMDATVVGTMLPTVIHDVGGATRGGYAWLVSGFLLAQVAATPVTGWIADRIGSRVLMVAAAGAFLAASLLAGVAHSFVLLVVARVLHGAAAGALVVSSYVIVGRLYGPERRAAAQGLLSTVWGVAAVVGPVLGATITGAWGWRWVFLLNVPLCLLVAATVLFGLPGRASVNSTGRALFPAGEYSMLIGGAALILLALQASGLGLGVAGGIVAAVLGVVLLAGVRRSRGALLVSSALRATPSGAGAVATLGACMVMYATVTVLPVQLAARGTTTTGIAVIIGVAALGWVVASAVTGGMLNARGYRIPMTVGAILLVIGASGAALGILPWAVGAAVGLGTGAVTAAALALMQDQAPPRQLGVATSSATLLRNLGAAAGINGLAALSTSSGAAHNPAFWALTAVAVLLVLAPAATTPSRRTTVEY